MEAEKAWHVQQGCFWKEAAFIGKVMETRKKETLPSVSGFWSEAGKNSQTLLDRTVKAMESVCSPWRKKASNAWEIAAKLNVKITFNRIAWLLCFKWCHPHFHPFSWLLFPLHQTKEHRTPRGRSLLLTSLCISCSMSNCFSMWLLNFIFPSAMHKGFYFLTSLCGTYNFRHQWKKMVLSHSFASNTSIWYLDPLTNCSMELSRFLSKSFIQK